jgi:hypothetical protein
MPRQSTWGPIAALGTGLALLAGCAGAPPRLPQGCPPPGGRVFLAEWAFAQYREAEYACARAALRTYLRHLERAEDPWLSPDLRAIDRTLTLGRLALLEERRGDHEAAARLWAQARAAAQPTGWGQMPGPTLRATVLRVDAIGDRRRPPTGPREGRP